MTRQAPRPGHLPDLKRLHGLFECTEEAVEEEVPVHLIVGTDVNAHRWNPDWTLREELRDEDLDMYNYHLDKLQRLIFGFAGLPPITQATLLEQKDIYLCKLEGLYWVTCGVHRVDVAHQKGFSVLKANVIRARFKLEAPREVRDWIESLRP